MVSVAVWHCYGCDSDCHGERYCLTYRTGEYSRVCSDAQHKILEVTVCAY